MSPGNELPVDELQGQEPPGDEPPGYEPPGDETQGAIPREMIPWGMSPQEIPLLGPSGQGRGSCFLAVSGSIPRPCGQQKNNFW